MLCKMKEKNDVIICESHKPTFQTEHRKCWDRANKSWTRSGTKKKQLEEHAANQVKW